MVKGAAEENKSNIQKITYLTLAPVSAVIGSSPSSDPVLVSGIANGRIVWLVAAACGLSQAISSNWMLVTVLSFSVIPRLHCEFE